MTNTLFARELTDSELELVAGGGSNKLFKVANYKGDFILVGTRYKNGDTVKRKGNDYVVTGHKMTRAEFKAMNW